MGDPVSLTVSPRDLPGSGITGPGADSAGVGEGVEGVWEESGGGAASAGKVDDGIAALRLGRAKVNSVQRVQRVGLSEVGNEGQ